MLGLFSPFFDSALSDQLWGHDLSHAWLRREICAYLLAHRERCENFVDADGGFDKYVREMQTTGTYGGHLELQVCAWLMRVNIKVIQPTVCPSSSLISHLFLRSQN